MAELWSDYSDNIIKNLDKQLSTKYKLTMRNLLTDPSKYADQPNILVTIDNLKEEVENYAKSRDKVLATEKKEFENAIVRADALTSQLGQSVSMQAKQNGVPVITPVALQRDTTKDEQIYVDSVDNATLALVGKLASSSMLIADFSTTYENYKVGEWLFSGDKDYIISVYMPANEYFRLQSSKDEIVGLLDTASGFIKGL
jgi:alpha-D-ribose 1-methylphosphonate 5-triphosphate diphosphatase PhnM